MRQSWLFRASLLLPMAATSLAHAEQFQIVDESYTHSTDTTMDSHYYPDLPADLPKDWTKPVDYSHGSVHIVLDVKTKPDGDAKTKYQLCFEGTPSYGCTLQSPTYTKTGRVEWDSPFDQFWFDGTVDWSQGIKKLAMILKDDNNNKPAGDPKYMPTDLHVQVVLVSAGSTFMPSSDAGSGGSAAGGKGGSGGVAAGGKGGTGGTGGRGGAAAMSGMAMAGAGGSARPQGAAGRSATTGGSGGSGGAANSVKASAGAPASQSAGAPASAPRTAGTTAASAGKGAGTGAGGSRSTTPTAANEAQVAPKLSSNAGCSSAGSARSAGFWVLAYAGWLTWRRRRTPQR